jgi:hypothetical protein
MLLFDHLSILCFFLFQKKFLVQTGVSNNVSFWNLVLSIVPYVLGIEVKWLIFGLLILVSVFKFYPSLAEIACISRPHSCRNTI